MSMTPKEIVAELDRYIISQSNAKRAVAIALRNRYRRSKLNEEMREEITPKNIIMKGPTGVGKTEIARRLAKFVKAPFVKVEATKFTEVGYVGRDVESMVRDLVEAGIRLVKEEKVKEVRPRALQVAEKIVISKVLPLRKQASPDTPDAELREQLIAELHKGQLDNIVIELKVKDTPKNIQLTPGGDNAINIGDIFGGMMPEKKKIRKITVAQAIVMLVEEEASKLIDEDSMIAEGLRRAEQDGIIFLDEIDKIAGKGKSSGPDVSREGVQRDILPIVEGCTVSTKYGSVRTDYILFIAAGAFHIAKVSDLIPELQGRFPISVTLDNLTKEDFVKILSDTDNALIRQYSELLKGDYVDLKFTKEALDEIATVAELENNLNENLGARRLHAVLEIILSELLFEAGEKPVEIVIDKDYVNSHYDQSKKRLNLTKYII